MSEVSKKDLVSSRFASFVFAHQLNRVRVLGGGVDAWIGDLFEFYAFVRSLDRVEEITNGVLALTVDLKYKQMWAVLEDLKSTASELSLDEVKAKLLEFYELIEEIESITGIDIRLDDDDEIMTLATEALHDQSG